MIPDFLQVYFYHQPCCRIWKYFLTRDKTHWNSEDAESPYRLCWLVHNTFWMFCISTFLKLQVFWDFFL
jgi:hypothetical protein